MNKQHWSERFDEEFPNPHNVHSWTYEECSCDAYGSENPKSCKDKFKHFIQTVEKEAVERERERCRSLIEDSEWECPIHGKEFKILPPLCKECNQCLEVNIILADVYKALEPRSSKESEEKV